MYLELKDFNEGETQENICMTIPGCNYCTYFQEQFVTILGKFQCKHKMKIFFVVYNETKFFFINAIEMDLNIIKKTVCKIILDFSRILFSILSIDVNQNFNDCMACMASLRRLHKQLASVNWALKGQCHEIFDPFLFNKKTLPGSHMNRLQRFQRNF